MNNPVWQLDRVFIDDLGQDWDLSGRPEEMILGVPAGTVESLLRQIDEKKLWPSLYKVAEHHSDQWMLDLSDFFPREEAFVEPLVSFLLMARSEHGRVCFAQEAGEWAWGENNIHLVPIAIQSICQVRDEIKGGNFESVIPTLESVIKLLSELTQSSASKKVDGSD